MKKIFLLISSTLLFLAGYAQSIVPIRGDTIRIYKQGDTSNLKVDSNAYVTGRVVVGKIMTNNASASIFLSDTAKALKYNNTYTRRNILNPVNGMRFYEDSTNTFLRYENGAWTADGSGGVDNDIENQFVSRQIANSNYDTSRLRKLQVYSIDSAALNWMALGGDITSVLHKNGKTATFRDRDTSSAFNDLNPDELVNTNVLVERVTRLNPAHSTVQRQNFAAVQYYETQSGGYVNPLSGNVGATILGLTQIKNAPGVGDTIYVLGGAAEGFWTPTILGNIGTQHDANTPADLKLELLGNWAIFSAHHNVSPGDSMANLAFFKSGGYAYGKFGSMTQLYIPTTNVVGQTQTAWGIFNSDPLNISRSLIGGRLLVGSEEFGTWTTPTYHSSAILQLNSHDRGFITSRMTEAEMNAISSPDTATFIWQSDSLRYYGYKPGVGWLGIAWVGESGGGGGGGLDAEGAQDAVASMMQSTYGLGWAYNDGANTAAYTIDSTAFVSMLRYKKLTDSVFNVSNAFVRNQFSGAQTSSNFWISGDGRIDGELRLGLNDQGTKVFQWQGDILGFATTSDGTQPMASFRANNGADRIVLWSDGHIGINLSTNPGVPIGVFDENIGILIKHNTSSAYTSLMFGNNLHNTFRLGLSGGSYPTTFYTGAPTGEIAFLGTEHAVGLALATNNTMRMFIQDDGEIEFEGVGTDNTAANVYVEDASGILKKRTVASLGGGMTNPMTDMGQLIYGGDGSGTPAALATTGAGLNYILAFSNGGIPYWTTPLQTGSTVDGLADANYTVSTAAVFVLLPTISANRTLTLPAAASFEGRVLIIKNQNSAGFAWQPNVNIKDATDGNISSLVNDTVYIIVSDGTDWHKIN